MNNVKEIWPGSNPTATDAPPDPAVIRVAEALLQKAKSGDLLGFMAVGIIKDHPAVFEAFRANAYASVNVMIGGLATMQAELLFEINMHEWETGTMGYNTVGEDESENEDDDKD